MWALDKAPRGRDNASMTGASRLGSIAATTTTLLLLLAVFPAAGSALSQDPNRGSAPNPGIYGQGAITVTSDGWIHYKSELAALESALTPLLPSVPGRQTAPARRAAPTAVAGLTRGPLSP
jgi:hypothetical protein